MKGTCRWEEIESPALKGNPLGDPHRRPLLVYLPPGYSQGTGRYPVVYFLHGFSGGGRQWTNFSGFTPTVPERLDNLIVSGAIPEVIAAFIDGWTAVGGTQWDNSEAVGRYRDYVTQDVVREMDARFRTVPSAAGRAVVGKSSGGYGALVMGRSQSDVFAHLGCHSGDAYFEYCYLPDFPKAASAIIKAGGVEPWYQSFVRAAQETKAKSEDFAVINLVGMAAAYSPKADEPMGIELPFELENGRLRPSVWERWLEKDPVRFVPREIASFKKLTSLFIDCGARDEFNLRWGARMVGEALEKGGVARVQEEFDDGHMGINYRYDVSLKYLVPRMARG